MTNNPPRFCKIIFDPVPDTIRIPQMFMQRHRVNLPDTVSLKVPCSSLLWKVEVIRDDDGDIWLEKGWKEFAEHYSINFGHYVVFQYDCELLRFNVNVFDLTSTEIIYPVESYEGISKTRKGKQKVNESSFMEPKMNKKSRADGSVEIPVRRSARNVDPGRNYTENNEHEYSFTEDSGLCTDTNRRFTKLLGYHNAYKIELPKLFAEGSGIARKREATLQNAEGKKWQAFVNVSEDKNRRRYFLGSGCNKFLIENMVTVGSTMSFNLSSSSDNTIEVRVVKVGSNENELFEYVKRRGTKLQSIDPYESSDPVRRVPEIIPLTTDNHENHDDHATSDSHTENTEKEDIFTHEEGGSRIRTSWRFTKQLMTDHAYRFLLPKEFSEATGISAHKKIVVQNVEGRTWPIHVVAKKGGRYEIGGGWKTFLIDNEVIVGSTMSFKFLSSSRYTIEAQVVEMGTDEHKLFKDVRKIEGGGYQLIASDVPIELESSEEDHIQTVQNENSSGVVEARVLRNGRKGKFSITKRRR